MSLLRNLAKCKSPATISQLTSATSSPVRSRHVVKFLTPKCRKHLDYSPAANSPRIVKALSQNLRPPDKSKLKSQFSRERSLDNFGDSTLDLIIGSQEKTEMNLRSKENPSFSCQVNDCSNLVHDVRIGPWTKWLGKGSFGVVVSAALNGNEVALKVCRKPFVSTVGEANAVSLRHPHLVRIFGTEDRANVRLIVMEIGGEKNLQNLLDDTTEAVNFDRRLRFCQQIGSGISYCHEKNLMHLDLKPSNILISKDHCKIGDFGCSVKYGTKYVETYEKCLLGTPRYCAPEILKSITPTYQSDVYSFGIIMWQIFTRQIPYGDLDTHVLIYKVVALHFRPLFPSLDNLRERNYASLSEKCWDSDPQQRPTSNSVVLLLSRI